MQPPSTCPKQAFAAPSMSTSSGQQPSPSNYYRRAAALTTVTVLGLMALVAYSSVSSPSVIPPNPLASEAGMYEEEGGRRLQHRPVTSWTTGESFETKNGAVPTISCPLGTYREFGNSNLARPVGQRYDGCEFCPRGRYGSTTDLSNSLCTAPCPKGRYRDTPGAASADDCRYCPEGVFGSTEGLTTKDCSGRCSDSNTASKQYYSDVKGLERSNDCKTCPVGYRGWQCKWDLVPRLGYFDSPNGKLDERAHSYLKTHDHITVGDGSWSATKKEGDYAGAWPTAGAAPEGAPNYPGKIAWDTKNEGFSYDPAATPRASIDTVP
ncbi:hypothetical protein TrVE_jg11673 [Triparma verrucosa]|uniref:Tyrosine-protein kinase ephrin type A/B receptor-like domain-containing protein n=1 Tax=Triparma verrucosa TaxID=1606542 RepID=A0A9W7DRN4_9STRA|nr:hypothetical protein TrVE_jg11673 [Triparma verrucosa]